MDKRWLIACLECVAMVSLIQPCSCTGQIPASKYNSTVGSKAEQSGFKVACYYIPTSFFPASRVPGNYCTHIIYGGIKIVGGASPSIIAPSHNVSADWRTLGSLRKAYPQMKLMVSLVAGFPEVVGPNITKIQQFATNSVAFLRKYELDGVDMDYEFPSGSQKAYLAKFFQIIRETMDKDAKARGKPSLLLSLAMPSSPLMIAESYDIHAISNAVDFGTVMTYDFHGYSSRDNKTGYNSPLYAPAGGEWKYSGSSECVNSLLQVGFPAKKLLLGIPTYGRSWTLANAQSHGLHAPAVGVGVPAPYHHGVGVYTFADSCVAMQQRSNTFDDGAAVGAYLYKGTNWVAYDNVYTVRMKCRWATGNGLGGVGVWALHHDDIDGVCDQGVLPLMKTMMRFT